LYQGASLLAPQTQQNQGGALAPAGHSLRASRRYGIFRSLSRATPEQRGQVRLSSRGLHWDALDEDVSVAGLLAGPGDPQVDTSFAA